MASDPPFLAPHRLETAEFVIRCYNIGDGPALAKAVNVSYEHLRPWMPWAENDQSPEVGEATCRRLAGEYLLGTNYTMGIWIGEELVGGTGFHLRVGDPGSGCAEIGMWIASHKAGTGLGTRVLEAMLKWSFTDWDWKRVVWKCATENIASARVAEKAGMTKEATFRSDSVSVDGRRTDTYQFAMLADEWRAAHP